ncbi:MAG: alpha-1,2-fucosyltransferase [Prevotella sp.]|nr:alpha-1,2-fucosyltransferase [Prevotella sp.]
MRVICDAPGQTCNRLWTYVASVAQCIAEHKRMVIIFYDWTIEDFPNLLHCKFIWFPLWHKWYLERGNGWNNYKGLTWKVTHNKTWDKIFKFLGFKKGWYTMDDTRYLAQTKKELQQIFRPREEIMEKAQAMLSNIRQEADFVVGVHIRHGDYKTFFDGRYYYTLEEFHQFMLRIQALYKGQRVAFFISSNEAFDVSIFEGCRCYRFGKEPSGDILDLYTLSLCNRILGPWSTYSRWASFIGEVPLCFIERKDQQFTDDSFSIVTDFYHFANGKSTEDFWAPAEC